MVYNNAHFIIKYCYELFITLLTQSCYSNFIITSSLRVDVLQFDNDVNNSQIIVHYVHKLLFIIKSIPSIYTPPLRGGLV